MLVLSRKVRETVIITPSNGETVEVFVVEIRGDKVRLAFTAPDSVIIDREEVHEAKQREKAQE